jgi:hypothetical protein
MHIEAERAECADLATEQHEDRLFFSFQNATYEFRKF